HLKSYADLIRGMVRFLRRHGCSQGQALTLGGVAETFVALNRGPRVQTMEIWSRGRRTERGEDELKPSLRLVRFASIDAVATRSDHAFRVERFLDRRAGLLEAWHGLRGMQ